ncbi:hypothetical protein NL676_007520 [Syzygium grande]|nr:hypothetical protein NL676_007520 [Syzygium grande]
MVTSRPGGDDDGGGVGGGTGRRRRWVAAAPARAATGGGAQLSLWAGYGGRRRDNGGRLGRSPAALPTLYGLGASRAAPQGWGRWRRHDGDGGRGLAQIGLGGVEEGEGR